LPVTHSSKCLKTEINTDLAIAASQAVFDFALDGDIPSAARILDEGTCLEFSLDLSRFPESEATLEVNSCIAIDADSAGHKDYPPECAPSTKARPISRASAMLISRPRELPAYLIGRVRMDSEIGGNACAKIDEINGARSANWCSHLPAPFIFALRSDTEIPNLIAANGDPVEVPSGARIFDPKFVGDHAHE